MSIPVGSSYSPDYDFPHFDREPDKFYIVATIPRSGSTFLSHELWKTGRLGAPLEYLNFEGGMLDSVGLQDLDAHLRSVRTLRTSPNGVFGIKLFPNDLKQASAVASGVKKMLIGKSYIYLTRADKVKQAVSYARAKQTGAWVGSSIEQCAPTYSEEAVDQALEQISVQEMFWENFFRRLSLTPLAISYEELVRDPSKTVGEIANHLNVELLDTGPRKLPPVLIQADERSDEWVSCYKKAKGLQ